MIKKEISMKQISTFINAILAAVIVFLLLSANLPDVKAQSAPTTPTPESTVDAQSACDSNRTVQVSGSALINVTPDRALIQLGVQSNGATPDSVQDANSEAIQKVIKALKAQGIEAKDIATDFYVIDPVYENYDSLYIKGYRINNIVAVTLRDVKKTSDIIAAALKAGANQVIHVEFYTSELRKYRDQARALAMEAAGEKAQALAGAAEAQAGCILSISENTWSHYYGSWRGGRETALWAQNVIQNAGSSQGESMLMDDSPITLGQIAIRAEVDASYSLR